MNTLYLDRTAWDLTADAAGNIAMASNPYALAQDCATAIRTFLGDVYYDQTIGIPYLTEDFNAPPPLELYRAQCRDAALAVPDVVDARVYFEGVKDRKLTGQVQLTDTAGRLSVASF